MFSSVPIDSVRWNEFTSPQTFKTFALCTTCGAECGLHWHKIPYELDSLSLLLLLRDTLSTGCHDQDLARLTSNKKKERIVHILLDIRERDIRDTKADALDDQLLSFSQNDAAAAALRKIDAYGVSLTARRPLRQRRTTTNGFVSYDVTNESAPSQNRNRVRAALSECRSKLQKLRRRPRWNKPR